MNVKELKAYQKYKDQIVLSDSVYESAYTEGLVEGIEQGIEQGIEKRNLEMLLNGYKNGLDIELLSKITDLTQERIREILKENGLL